MFYSRWHFPKRVWELLSVLNCLLKCLFCIIYGNFFLYKYLEKHTESNKAVKEADKKKDRQRNIIPARASFHCAGVVVTSFLVFTICYSIPVGGGLSLNIQISIKSCRTSTLIPSPEPMSCVYGATSIPAFSVLHLLYSMLHQSEENSNISPRDGSKFSNKRFHSLCRLLRNI